MDKKELITIRGFQSGDIPYIMATWLRGAWHGNDFYHLIDHDAFFNNYRGVVEGILNKPSTYLRVACLIDDADVILGYSVLEPGILHWVHVKEAWHRLGIAKDLIPADTRAVTHLTEIGKRLKKREWVFNPFLI